MMKAWLIFEKLSEGKHVVEFGKSSMATSLVFRRTLEKF
jgi:hypothetical protein